MISVAALFLVFAGIVLLGYIINSLFYKLKISSPMLLLVIGLLIGPVLHVVNTSPTSTISQISPIVSALAIAFVLFDVGMSIRLKSLSSVLLRTTRFTFVCSMLTGAAMFAFLYFTQGWGVLLSLMAGFALSGTTSIILPPLFKIIKVNENLKTSMAFQSVFNDVFSLVLPLIFFDILATHTYSFGFVAGELGGFIIGSTILGILFAIFWIFILRKFKRYSSQYSWMLTLTIVLAVYGSAEYLNFNGALATFIFGIIFANVQDMGSLIRNYVKPVVSEITHIKSYQREISFFVSTFFFVYIGMLFYTPSVTYTLIIITILMALTVLIIRSAVLRWVGLGNAVSTTGHAKSETMVMRFYIAQGMAPAIIATLPATIGLNVPNFIDIMFLMILFTNAVLSFGLYLYVKELKKEDAGKPQVKITAAGASVGSG